MAKRRSQKSRWSLGREVDREDRQRLIIIQDIGRLKQRSTLQRDIYGGNYKIYRQYNLQILLIHYLSLPTMEIQFKHMVLIYAVLIFALFLYKPQLFRLNIEDQNLRKRKFTTLVALFIILAIITYYIKIFLSRDQADKSITSYFFLSGWPSLIKYVSPKRRKRIIPTTAIGNIAYVAYEVP